MLDSAGCSQSQDSFATCLDSFRKHLRATKCRQAGGPEGCDGQARTDSSAIEHHLTRRFPRDDLALCEVRTERESIQTTELNCERAVPAPFCNLQLIGLPCDAPIDAFSSEKCVIARAGTVMKIRHEERRERGKLNAQ